MIISKGIQVAANDIISFFLCLRSIPFIHPSVDEHLGCFHVFTIVDSVTVNIEMHIFSN